MQILRDLTGFAGLALTLTGVWWLAPPCALILLGLVTLSLALILTAAATNERDRP